MKKYKRLFFIMIFIFIFPLFCFACDEKTFDDISYVASSKTAEDVVDDIDYARSQAISNEIKMNLQMEEKYTFYNTSDDSVLSKVILNKTNVVVGKDRDKYIFFNDKQIFNNNELSANVSEVYERGEGSFNSNAFYYVENKNYTNGEVSTVDFSRNQISYSSTTTLTELYSQAIKKVEAFEFDSVLEKSFDGVNYYKLVSNVEGLSRVNERFVVGDVINNPNAFIKNDETDYVFSYSCEFGIKEASGTVYLTYFKMDYSIYNYIAHTDKTEKYLDVSIKTNLLKYGDVVEQIEIEDKGEYISNTFVKLLNQDNSYCVFKNADKSAEDKETLFTVLKIKKHDEQSGIEYFDYAINTLSTTSNYYYVEGAINSQNETYAIEYIMYKLNKQTKEKSEVSNFNFYLGQFDFNQKYNKKVLSPKESNDDNCYFFGLNESDNNKIKVYTNKISGEINEVEFSGTKLEIQSYGKNDGGLDVISNIDDFELKQN